MQMNMDVESILQMKFLKIMDFEISYLERNIFLELGKKSYEEKIKNLEKK